MKSFKEIRKKLTRKLIGWDSSFAELRDKKKKVLPMLSWDSSFAENRKKDSLKEAAPVESSHANSIKKHQNLNVHKSVGLTNPDGFHKNSILKYTSVGSNEPSGHGSSANMNAYLRNRAGDKSQGVIRHKHDEVRQAVVTLASAFTKENTNKKPIKTFGAIPSHIGNHFLKAEKGSQHSLAGFTSTTADPKVATNFARKYARESRDEVRHLVRYHVHPGAGLSTHHADNRSALTFYPSEKEIILNHGAHVTYHGTEKYKDSSDKTTTYVHHLEVHPHRTELHEYPSEYKHPK